MKKKYTAFLRISLILIFMFAPSANVAKTVYAQELPMGCASSSNSGSYEITICITSPAIGSVLSGNVTVSVSVDSTGSFPGVQRMIFYLNNEYLLIDYQSPYIFQLPTTYWMDGNYTLSVEALLRDAFVTQRSNISLVFNNGIITPPVNTNVYQPASGRPPNGDEPFTVAAGGDGASGELNSGYVTNLLASIDPNLFLWLGDVMEKGSMAEFYNWYGVGNVYFGQFRSITNPTIGNHEYENGVAPGYFYYWDNIPNYYSYDANGWHFISLNSNSAYVVVDALSAQYQWLAQDLASHQGTCTIIYYHHPRFSIGSQGDTPELSDIWALMAQNGVEIVINGHDHNYQRWVPLDGNGQPSPTGITEFVAGATGHGVTAFATTDSRVVYASDDSPNAYGVLLMKLNPDGAKFSYQNIYGVVLDSGTIPCSGAGQDTTAPSTPANVTGVAVSATQVDLSWSASTDNVGVKGYTIYRDGVVLATVGGAALSYSDTSGWPATTYQYSVDAFDAAGNHSVASAPVTVTTTSLPSSLTFTTEADTYVNAASPASNYGLVTTLRVDASPDVHSYVRFTVNGLAGEQVKKAQLLIYTNTSASQGFKAWSIGDNSWGELTTNYTNAPALGSVLASTGSISAGSWATLDVTSYVKGEGVYSFGVTTPSSTATSMSSREGSFAPQLVVDLQFVAPDTQAPSVPTGLTATAVNSTQVNLGWSASTDNVGVTGYTVYRNGSILAIVGKTVLTYSDTTAQPSSTYQYSVNAFDAAGNYSAASAPVTVTTPGVVDTQAPSVPTGLTAAAVSATQVNLGWNASTDNIGVTGYRIYRNGSILTTVAGTVLTYSDTTALPSTTYQYSVDAFDAAGNHSAASAPVGVTTPALPSTMNFTTEADTYVNAASPASNYGLVTTLRVDASPDVHSYVRFTVNGLAGKQVQRARLLIYTNTSANQGFQARAVADNSWGELTTNYTNAPALGNVLASTGSISSGTWATFDVTSYVTGEGVYSFGVTTPSSTATSMSSREGSFAPQLVIDLQTGTPDTQPPSVPVNLIATAVNSTQVNLGWSASTDNVGVTGYLVYRDGAQLANAGLVTSYSDTTVVPSTSYQYTVKAYDQAGNVSTASQPASVTTPAGSTPPSVTLTAPAGGALLTGTVTLSATASDNVAVSRVDFLVNGSLVGSDNTVPYSLNWNSATVADGAATITAHAVNSANLSADSSVVVTVDNNPPDTSITTAPPAVTSSTSASFSFTATETATFQCSLDGSAYSACTSPADYTGLAGGSHTFHVIATDTMGHTDATPASYTWNIDTVAPDTSITSAPASLSNSASATFSFTSNESGVTFECRLNSAAFSACTSPTTYDALTNSTYSFQVRAVDAAGNTDDTPASHTWTVDTVAPNASILGGPSGYVNSATATFSFTSNDATATLLCSLDGASYSPCASPATYTNLSNGSHTFQVTATDGAGNTDTTPASQTWIVDTVAPTDVFVTSPLDGATISRKTAVKATANDSIGVMSVSFYIDGQLYAVDQKVPYSITWDIAGFAKGAHMIYVVAGDAAGNTTQSPSITVTIK